MASFASRLALPEVRTVNRHLPLNEYGDLSLLSLSFFYSLEEIIHTVDLFPVQKKEESSKISVFKACTRKYNHM